MSMKRLAVVLVPAALVVILALVVAASAGCGKQAATSGLTSSNPPASGAAGTTETAGAPETTATSAPAAPGQKTILDVYVPCAFAPAADKMAKIFEAAHPGVQVNRTVENVSVLAPRIENGAKPDVFMCNGDREIMAMEKKGVVADKRDICFTALMLLVPKANPAGVKNLKDLTKPAVKSIGVGAEETSVGYYAEQMLKQNGVWDKLQSKLVRPKFPIELLKLAAQGKVQASIAYGTCMKSKEGEHPEQAAHLKMITDFQSAFCQTIPCQAVSIKGCANPALAKQFIDFLTDPQCQKIFASTGFETLSETKCYTSGGPKTTTSAGAKAPAAAGAKPAAPAPASPAKAGG